MNTNDTILTRMRSALSRKRVMHAPSHPALTQLAEATCRVPLPAPIPVPRRPRFAAVAAIAAMASLAALTAAQADNDYETRSGNRFVTTADGRLVDVQVQVEGHGVVPLYTANGRYDRSYFQAFKGRNYSLVLRNNTNRRVGVLIAVDGLNVINGERSALARHESMYVLDPHEQATIRGWRTSLSEVRRFVFVDEERSYAERTGQANGDMGWIRVLAFREQRAFWEDFGKIREGQRRDGLGESRDSRAGQDEEGAAPSRPEANDAAPRAQGQESPEGPTSQFHGERRQDIARESTPGTGWGDRRHDQVNRTHFVAERQPVDRITLRYEYASGLRALGITPVRVGHDRVWDRERGHYGFAQSPKR